MMKIYIVLFQHDHDAKLHYFVVVIYKTQVLNQKPFCLLTNKTKSITSRYTKQLHIHGSIQGGLEYLEKAKTLAFPFITIATYFVSKQINTAPLKVRISAFKKRNTYEKATANTSKQKQAENPPNNKKKKA